MKKIIGLGVLALAGVAVASCAGSNGDNLTKKDIIGLDDNSSVAKMGEFDMLFKKGSEIPYVSLKDGVQMMSQIRAANLDDKKYNYAVTTDNGNYVVSNETGAKCVLSVKDQTLTYNDYDKFTNYIPEGQNPLTIVPVKSNNKCLKVVSSEYTPGKEVVVDLKPYTLLDVYENGGNCYIPLSVFNSFLFNTNLNTSLAYNGNEVFMTVGNQFGDTSLFIPYETDLGKRFRQNAMKDTISQEYADYYYQSLCLDFNYQYGLKDKFTKFEDFLNTKGYAAALNSTNPKNLDLNTAYALSALKDGHTALTEFSNLYKFRDVEVDDKKMDAERSAFEKADEAYTAAYKKAGIKEGLEYKDETVFVTFSKFTDVDPDLLYKTKTDKSADEDDITGLDDGIGFDFSLDIASLLGQDTAQLFNKLYKDLTSDEHKWSTKNIVVDLTANEGGAADALIYSLSVLIGNVTIDMTNPLSGAHNHLVYKADINADGVIDDKDKSLSELGFKIYFLDSRYSFSSANAMPVLAKLNKPNVVTLGDKTAGGPCAVRTNVTPIGSIVTSSSLNTISKLVNGKYVNIDDGVAADFTLTEAQMIDREYIKNNIKNWVK